MKLAISAMLIFSSLSAFALTEDDAMSCFMTQPKSVQLEYERLGDSLEARIGKAGYEKILSDFEAAEDGAQSCEDYLKACADILKRL